MNILIWNLAIFVDFNILESEHSGSQSYNVSYPENAW